MTTKAAENLYLAQHLYSMEGKKYAVYNPLEKPVESLPTIWGFNNGGSRDMLLACLISDDGNLLGGHSCSHEGYMRGDLGILEGTRPDRHDTFAKHYPDGYKMAFVGYDDFKEHGAPITAALALAAKKKEGDAE